MTRALRTAADILALAALVATATPAQTSPASKPADATVAPPPAAKSATVDDLVKQIKKPADWFNWGGDLRIRNEYYNNAVTLSDFHQPLHEQDVIRFRGRVWGSWMPVTDLSLNARLSAEPRQWIKPSFATAVGGEQQMEWRYGIFDNLNVKWQNAFNQPITVTAGRQDIALGDYYDWWLVLDGTPGDGSWTFFLDSVRMSAECKHIQTKFDLIYIYQNARPNGTLPTLGSIGFRHDDTEARTDYQLTEQNEQGVVLYASNKTIANTQIDGYFIYKRDRREDFLRLGVDTPYGDNADLYTVGGKITGTPWPHWQYSVEGAYQFGLKQDTIQGIFEQRDVDAYGAKAKLTYLFQDPWHNQLSLIGEFLSGDNPKSTGKDEMFDVLWGRWPRWSELYIYSYIYETSGKIAQLNNIGRFGPSWTCAPTKKLTLSAMYNALYAPEAVPTRRIAPAATLYSNDGNFRGHYLQTILKYQFNQYVSGHLWGEWVWEGNYYNQRDVMTFLRAEVMVAF